MFWPTVSRPISLGVGHPFGTHDQILLFPFYFSGKLLCSSSWGALSDERTGLHFSVQSVSGQSRGGLTTIHYCLTWDYWVPFPSPLTTRRDYGGSILELNCVVFLTALRPTQVKTLLATTHVAFVGCHGNPVYRVVTWIPISVSVAWSSVFPTCGRIPWEAPTWVTVTTFTP
jgi:hypothetical protein